MHSLRFAYSRSAIGCRSVFLGPSDTSEFSSPRKITKTLAATRIENATFREKLDSHELEVRKRDRFIGELEGTISASHKELEDAKKTLSKWEARAHQEESRNKLVDRELQMLKAHLVRPSSSRTTAGSH